MSDDLDLKRMAEIPDPFAGPSRGPATERVPQVHLRRVRK
jgi:hypothetical protein